MLRIEMLPAHHGDALLLEWGSAAEPHRMLVDGGPYYAYDAIRARLRAIPADRRRIDVLVITHIDADHIEGILRLLLDRELGVELGDIWFNDWSKIEQVPDDALGSMHGEYVGALLDRDRLPWNLAFGGKAVALTADGVARKLTPLPGDLQVTLLSPGPRQLRALKADWERSLAAVHFTPGSRARALEQLERQARYAPPADELGAVSDTSAANGSSIAMLVEQDGKRALLTGDAFPETLEASLATLGDVAPVHAFKLSHHGSFSNSSRRLLELVPAHRYLISTNGARYKHPHKQTLELILAARRGGTPRVTFNYHGAAVGPWVEAHDAKQIIAEFPEGWGIDL